VVLVRAVAAHYSVATTSSACLAPEAVASTRDPLTHTVRAQVYLSSFHFDFQMAATARRGFHLLFFSLAIDRR
jgi:hypothetical protein